MRFYREIIQKLKILLLILALSVFIPGLSPIGYALLPCAAVSAAEAVGAVYLGDVSAQAVIDGLKYTDLGGGIWSAEAIYESGALGILKGLDGAGRQFDRNTALTKEEALAIVYRAAGREEEALQAGTAVNNARAAGIRKTDPKDVLLTGFFAWPRKTALLPQGSGRCI